MSVLSAPPLGLSEGLVPEDRAGAVKVLLCVPGVGGPEAMAVWHGDTGYLVWGSPFLSAKWVSRWLDPSLHHRDGAHTASPAAQCARETDFTRHCHREPHFMQHCHREPHFTRRCHREPHFTQHCHRGCSVTVAAPVLSLTPLSISCHRASGGGRGDPTADADQERRSLCDPEAAQEPSSRGGPEDPATPFLYQRALLQPQGDGPAWPLPWALKLRLGEPAPSAMHSLDLP